VQHWFFEHHQDQPERFNTSILLQLAAPLDRVLLSQALERVIQLHPALRLSFTRAEAHWSQLLSDALVAESFLFFDLRDIEESAQVEWVAQKSEQIQGSFQLDQPPLLRLAYFACGAGQNNLGRKDRLLVVFHHLVSDGVSIRIFVEDIVSAYIQLLAGATQDQGVNFHLPGEATSFLEWTRRLESYAQSTELESEIGYWKGQASLAASQGQRSAIPVDYPDGENTYGLVDHLTHFLSQSVTDTLVRKMPARFAVSVQAVLLSALVKTMAHWTGTPALWIETEGHGREEIPGTALGGVDLSRTMGWFTSLYPLYLEIDPQADPLESATQVEQQIRKVPHRGVGFGPLKYLSKNEEVRAQMQEIPAPELNFNYLGQFDQTGTESRPAEAPLPYNSPASALLEVSAESPGQEQNPTSSRSARLYLVASVSGGQLGFRWLYSRGLHRRETVLKFAQMYQVELERIAGLVEQ
jgi:non-ribosomal peptide synthase protein (TIGR01720 family)